MVINTMNFHVAELEAFSKRRVFHGTNQKAAQLIQKNGFDVNKAQNVDFFTGLRTVLGACVYFAPDYFKAAHIARQKFGEEAVVLEYVLDTGKMKLTGSACYEWQADFDTCYLVGKLSERKLPKGAPEATLVQFDEIGVSYRVLKTHLQFIACHPVKQKKFTKSKPKKNVWKKKKDVEMGDAGWTPDWYTWDHTAEDSQSKRQAKNARQSKWKNRAGHKAVTTPTTRLPDVVPTRNGNYVSPPKHTTGERTTPQKNNQRWNGPSARSVKSQKSQSRDCEFESNDDGSTYVVHIPDFLLAPTGYSSAKASSDNVNANASHPEKNDFSSPHVAEFEAEVFSDEESGCSGGANNSTHFFEEDIPSKIESPKIERRAFRTIETTNKNIPLHLHQTHLVKSDPGKYMKSTVPGKETVNVFTADVQCDLSNTSDEFSDSGSSSAPTLGVDTTGALPAKVGEMRANNGGRVTTMKASQGEVEPVSFINAPALYPNVINVGLPLSPINYLSSPTTINFPVVFAPSPFFPLLCPSPSVNLVKPAEPVIFCPFSSPGGNEFSFGVLGGKGC